MSRARRRRANKCVSWPIIKTFTFLINNFQGGEQDKEECTDLPSTDACKRSKHLCDTDKSFRYFCAKTCDACGGGISISLHV